MAEKKAMTGPDRATRGKRLVMYGMFALIVVTFVSVFVTLRVITAPLGAEFTGIALQTALIVSAVALVACVAGWFVYTKVLLKE